jgi:hypothetical protein
VTRVLVISFSDLASDPRLDRQIGALRTRYDVVAAGLGPPAYPDVEFVDITPPPRGMPGQALGLARRLAHRHEAVYWKHPGYRAVAARLRQVRADVIVANDIPPLPIALGLGPPVVLDAHEYAPDELGESRWWRVLLRPSVLWIVREYVPHVAAMTTVAQSIAEAYEHDTGVRASVVSNAPPYAEIAPTPVHDPVRILHHGLATPGRGLEDMVRLADLVTDRFTFDFVLMDESPRFMQRLRRRARDNPRVRFRPPVPMRLLPLMANDYDIGLFLLPPVNRSRLYALPNKFFEFVQGRLAIAIGPSPEMAALVRRYGLGVVAPDFEPESLAAELERLGEADIAGFKAASHAAARELCAEANAGTLLRAVEDALARRAPPSAAAGG